VTPPKPRPLNLAQHALALRQGFPGATLSLRGGRLVWTSWLQPTPLSRRYFVRIELGHDGLPHVRVIEPQLESRGGASLPHVYREGTLCLYSRGEWHPGMSLVLTIVPWASEWLMNYEIWLATGEWHGGGEWPPRRRDPSKSAA
jgi:hypothetical protein